MTLTEAILLFGAGGLAGMINSVAGGGTLLTFPALYWAGNSAIVANATSTVALVPGAWGSLWGYRSQLSRTPRKFFILLVPSLIGGIIGAVLLRSTPPLVFDRIVPWLILGTTFLFMLQEPVQRWLKTSDLTHHPMTFKWGAIASFYQLLVAVYGGYFGAGIGILMLAALGFMGLTNIHQMNGLKNIFGSSINLVAAGYFILAGMVNWKPALVMMAGAIIGGYGAAGLAQRLGQKFVRRAVIFIGFAMAVSMFVG